MEIKRNPNGSYSMFDKEVNIITFRTSGKNRTEFYKLEQLSHGLIKGSMREKRTGKETHTYFNHEFKCIYFYINAARVTTFNLSNVHSNGIIEITTSEQNKKMLFKCDKDLSKPLYPLSFNVNGINMTELDWCVPYSNNTIHVCIKTKVLTSITEHEFIYDLKTDTASKFEISI